MTHAVFLDTMVYLHYKPVEEIDWHAILGVPRSDSIVIVVPGVTLREIDNHKNHTARLRVRARQVSQSLASWQRSGTTAIRTGVTVEYELRLPAIDYVAEGLDPNVPDDELVASALAYMRTNPDISVTLVTHDSYPEIRARGFGLNVVALPDHLRKPLPEDPTERENRELRRQVEKLRSALPMLELLFDEREPKSLRVPIQDVGPLEESELNKAIADAETRYPPADDLRPRNPSDASSPTDLDRLGGISAALL
jgi:hypothetical protein